MYDVRNVRWQYREYQNNNNNNNELHVYATLCTVHTVFDAIRFDVSSITSKFNLNLFMRRQTVDTQKHMHKLLTRNSRMQFDKIYI